MTREEVERIRRSERRRIARLLLRTAAANAWNPYMLRGAWARKPLRTFPSRAELLRVVADHLESL